MFLNWETNVGVLTVAYDTAEQGHARPEWVRDFKPDTRCLLEAAQTGFHAPDGPDVYDLSIRGDDRGRLWRYYSRAIGQPAPYWPRDLGHRELIEAWRPGNATVVAVPRQRPDLTPLLELAALYPADSAVHRVLTYYYRKSARSAAGGSRIALECFGDEMAFPELTDKLTIAARAVDIPEPEKLDEQAIRAVFAEIMERKDTLAERVVECIRRWGAQRYFPFATVERYRAEECVMLGEWLHQLDEVPVYLPDPKFGYALSIGRHRGVSRRLVDRATGAPVMELVDHHGEVDEYVTLLPRRLPATTPLVELIVDCGGQSLWVRTEDGTLYPAPGGEYGVAWGYLGSMIAPLVERLLDDINTAPIDEPEKPADTELTRWTKKTVPSGTVFTRRQLEKARRRS